MSGEPSDGRLVLSEAAETAKPAIATSFVARRYVREELDNGQLRAKFPRRARDSGRCCSEPDGGYAVVEL